MARAAPFFNAGIHNHPFFSTPYLCAHASPTPTPFLNNIQAMKPFSLVMAALALLQSGVVATDTVLKYTSYHDDSTCKGTSYYAAAWDTGVRKKARLRSFGGTRAFDQCICGGVALRLQADCSANATACADNEGMYYSATCSSDSPSTLMSGNIGQATYSDSACSSTALLTDTVSVRSL